MTVEVTSIKCPNCGGGLDRHVEVCSYCDSPVIIRTFNTIASMPLPQVNKYIRNLSSSAEKNPSDADTAFSLAVCYLRIKLYDKALKFFEKAMEEDFENCNAYFYAAISILKGGKAFLLPRDEIDKILEYINAACSIDPQPIFIYFHAYIKYDYFKRKFLNTNPTYDELLKESESAGLTEPDKEQLFAMLGVERPVSL